MDQLELEQVSHSYGDLRVVDAADLRVGAGEMVCLLGPSGCGKTTTLRLAAGLETLQEGRIRIGGREVARPGFQLPPEERGVGMVFQDYALFPHLSALENVAFGLSHLSAAERRRIAADLLARLEMTRHIDSYPHVLSGGEQQRVALARALAPGPAVMLMDEPFSNLDVRLRDTVRDDTLALLTERGTATLLVTHDPEEAMRMADRIAVMRAGRIIQTGTPAQLYRQPTSRFIAEFFSEINTLTGVVGDDGAVDTIAGRVAAPGLALGTPVDVLVRPEAVLLNGASGGAAAVVEETRSLGAYAIVALRLAADGRRLRCRREGGRLPETGAQVGVALDPGQTFVFPREDD